MQTIFIAYFARPTFVQYSDRWLNEAGLCGISFRSTWLKFWVSCRVKAQIGPCKLRVVSNLLVQFSRHFLVISRVKLPGLTMRSERSGLMGTWWQFCVIGNFTTVGCTYLWFWVKHTTSQPKAHHSDSHIREPPESTGPSLFWIALPFWYCWAIFPNGRTSCSRRQSAPWAWILPHFISHSEDDKLCIENWCLLWLITPNFCLGKKQMCPLALSYSSQFEGTFSAVDHRWVGSTLQLFVTIVHALVSG